MKSLRLYSLLFFILLSVTSVSAAEKIRVAVLDLKAVGIAEKISGTVSSMIRIDLVNIGKFFVVERTQMDEILKEQGFQKTGCTDQECAVELGRMMSARKILLGEVSSLGNLIIITVRIVDVEKGVSEFAAREKAESKDELDNAVSRIVEKLSEQIEQEGETWSITDAYYMRGFVPGWGQMYAGNKTKGIIFGSSFIAACAITVFSVLNYNNAKSDYDDLPSGADRDEFKEKRDDYDNAALYVNISVGLVSAVYIANLIDILFFSKPSSNRTAGIMDHGDNFITLDVISLNHYSKDNRFVAGIGKRF